MSRKKLVRKWESRFGRRWPKRLPSKYLRDHVWCDWPYCGPAPGRPIREFVRIARLREEREAWRIEHLNA